MNYRYIGNLVKIAECVGTLTKLEIPIRQKRVRLVPPDATRSMGNGAKWNGVGYGLRGLWVLSWENIQLNSGIKNIQNHTVRE